MNPDDRLEIQERDTALAEAEASLALKNEAFDEDNRLRPEFVRRVEDALDRDDRDGPLLRAPSREQDDEPIIITGTAPKFAKPGMRRSSSTTSTARCAMFAASCSKAVCWCPCGSRAIEQQ